VIEGAARGDVVANALILGDLVNANDKAFLDTFPYVPTANNTSVNQTSGGGLLPEGLPKGPLPIPMGFGAGALGLIGIGAWMLRRRSEQDLVRGHMPPAADD
jgi:hypothetical protein